MLFVCGWQKLYEWRCNVFSEACPLSGHSSQEVSSDKDNKLIWLHGKML